MDKTRPAKAIQIWASPHGAGMNTSVTDIVCTMQLQACLLHGLTHIRPQAIDAKISLHPVASTGTNGTSTAHLSVGTYTGSATCTAMVSLTTVWTYAGSLAIPTFIFLSAVCAKTRSQRKEGCGCSARKRGGCTVFLPLPLPFTGCSPTFTAPAAQSVVFTKACSTTFTAQVTHPPVDAKSHPVACSAPTAHSAVMTNTGSTKNRRMPLTDLLPIMRQTPVSQSRH